MSKSKFVVYKMQKLDLQMGVRFNGICVLLMAALKENNNTIINKTKKLFTLHSADYIN